MHEELCNWGVQVNTYSAGNKVEEDANLAVKRGSPDRFYSGDRDGIPLHRESLYICASEGSVDLVPDL